MSRVSKLLARGAAYVARERGLDQKPYRRPEFVEGGNSLLPVAGEVVLVNGIPITKTGRVLSGDPERDGREAIYAMQVAILQDRYTEMHRIHQTTVGREKVRVRHDPVKRKMHEMHSLYAWQRQGTHAVRKRKSHELWSLDGYGSPKNDPLK